MYWPRPPDVMVSGVVRVPELPPIPIRADSAIAVTPSLPEPGTPGFSVASSSLIVDSEVGSESAPSSTRLSKLELSAPIASRQVVSGTPPGSWPRRYARVTGRPPSLRAPDGGPHSAGQVTAATSAGAISVGPLA